MYKIPFECLKFCNYYKLKVFTILRESELKPNPVGKFTVIPTKSKLLYEFELHLSVWFANYNLIFFTADAVEQGLPCSLGILLFYLGVQYPLT